MFSWKTLKRRNAEIINMKLKVRFHCLCFKKSNFESTRIDNPPAESRKPKAISRQAIKYWSICDYRVLSLFENSKYTTFSIFHAPYQNQVQYNMLFASITLLVPSNWLNWYFLLSTCNPFRNQLHSRYIFCSIRFFFITG